MLRLIVVAGFMTVAGSLWAETPAGIKPYVSEEAPILVLNHVRIIDGTA